MKPTFTTTPMQPNVYTPSHKSPLKLRVVERAYNFDLQPHTEYEVEQQLFPLPSRAQEVWQSRGVYQSKSEAIHKAHELIEIRRNEVKHLQHQQAKLKATTTVITEYETP